MNKEFQMQSFIKKVTTQCEGPHEDDLDGV